MKSKASHPVVVHGVGPPFGGRGAFKVLQLLQQLLAEGPGEHRQAEDAGSFSGEHRQLLGSGLLSHRFTLRLENLHPCPSQLTSFRLQHPKQSFLIGSGALAIRHDLQELWSEEGLLGIACCQTFYYSDVMSKGQSSVLFVKSTVQHRVIQ